jgi:myo-inositol 2-dehydrogenase / D-chiro-inositol 1-dehydrogenase
MRDVGIGLVGSGFIAQAHAEAFTHVPASSIRGIASPTPGHAEQFAGERGIPRHHTDYRALIEQADVDVVCIAAPNDLHRDITVAAADAGKHVICEKPLARTLREADEMIAACSKAGTLLMYAEELCFAPKYVRAKELADEGALGSVHLVRQGEQHFGPHSGWFWDPERAGGGVLMDMGCHGIEFARWVYGKAPAESATAELGTFVHGARTTAEDHAVGVIRFSGNRLGVIETSWAKPGGMDDRAELIGSEGVTYVDILRGSSLMTYSEHGYGYAVEKAPRTSGWTFTMFEEIWNYGFPQEMRHFVDCVLSGAEPMETGADGRAVLEIIYAMYMAAGGAGRVSLPLEITPEVAARPPYLCWREPAAGRVVGAD